MSGGSGKGESKGRLRGSDVVEAVKAMLEEIFILFLEILALVVLPAVFLISSPKNFPRYLCTI